MENMVLIIKYAIYFSVKYVIVCGVLLIKHFVLLLLLLLLLLFIIIIYYLLFTDIFLTANLDLTDGPLEYDCATSGTIRSYPSPLGIMPIHQFRRKRNKYEKNPVPIISISTRHNAYTPIQEETQLRKHVLIGYKITKINNIKFRVF
ncbi:hypothetical protein Hanom_Chr03g00215421 [Helianthus anomalus]